MERLTDLEAENRALREALKAYLDDHTPGGVCDDMARAALDAEPASGDGQFIQTGLLKQQWGRQGLPLACLHDPTHVPSPPPTPDKP